MKLKTLARDFLWQGSLRAAQADVAASLPLRTIYLLERVKPDELKSSEILKVPSIEALPTIMQGISNNTILSKKRLAEQFRLITQMLAKVPVKHLRYPSDMQRLTEVCNTVNADR